MKKQLFSLMSCILIGTAVQAQNIFFDDFGTPFSNFNNWESVERDNDQSGSHNTWHPNFNSGTGMTGGIASSFAMGPNRDHLFKSRVISLPQGSTNLSYKIAAEPNDEHYAVYILPAGNIFQGTENPILEETINNGVAVTKRINIPANLAGQQIRIYFRHFQQGEAFLHLDDVTISEGTLDVSESTVSKHDRINVYPNPVRNELYIKSPEKIISTEVFDMAGRLIQMKYDGSVLDMSKLGTGNYILKIETSEGITTKKIIKE
ncbi:MAG: T9SS type A sorting domain-containing protein [Chryseobacterium sp.]|jgi:hypothetical protein|uniref:T9SS type A sorting domain-containing protein n=1 Tax=Chryseobacterium sp. TaxID=1871047 RepID=UPI002818E406|nr:T9SS type A sorting domain-containing protein [Chryseobacterium sp.]MDR2235807.1 T9SS type A sorting domain-containing protein [Chryseobacterium sp.]